VVGVFRVIEAGPIFLLGLQRGGTNQPLNVLRSHPSTYWPAGEFHEPFRPRNFKNERFRAVRKLARYAPIWLAAGDVLNLDAPLKRARPLKGFAGRALRAGLAASCRSNAGLVAIYRATLRDRGFAPDRMVVKVMNYNVGLVPDLLDLYPNARFVGIIRDGRGVCEGQMARRAEVEQATALYTQFGEWLSEYEAAGLPIRTWRFEDMLADPWATGLEMYDFCGLDPDLTLGVRLQDKHRILGDKDRITGIAKYDHYYLFSEMSRHMRADANASSFARLSEAARGEIESRCGGVLRRFGYLADPASAPRDVAPSPAATVPAEPQAVAG
jgi:hypothetical protein